MTKRGIPHRGDVYFLDPNPVAGKEMQNKHRFVVITPKEINALGVCITVAVTTSGLYARQMGITVNITGYDTTGVAVCNQLRSFDLQARVKAGSAKYIETLDSNLTNEIVDRVLSIIEPEV